MSAPEHHHDHGAHEHQHHGGADWDAMSAHLELEARLHRPYLEAAADWMDGLLGADGARVRRLLDVGSGPGVVTCLLARRFPSAEAVAVDQSPALLERVRARAADQALAGRVGTLRAELPEDLGKLGEADLVWTSHAVHHVGDQQAALDGLAAVLRPGGLLAVAERGLSLRCLPRDIGIGRPGLQARLDALHEELFADMRADLPGSVPVVEDWPAMLARTGLAPAGSRTFLTEYQAPLGDEARAYLHTRLSRFAEVFDDRLDEGDRATLKRLADPDDPSGILRRADAFLLSATTVHAARRD
ncbi:trans-aconitate 2-methyltransferase [Nocardiopsis sp. CNT312]|uniref:class I SAM-dependent methyltransferase n=1 Tax=Nocardiopsis sp. CNT312 TaxID=1137268 RepID=UPI00048C9201|nr:class I SAM-dependent methyltransferase [Nocardiopsis sp. CNT312]